LACARLCRSRPQAWRNFSTTVRRQAIDPDYAEWIREEGRQFKKASPRNWLGGDVPFPLNPSFKPPTPVSDTLKTHIYDQYMANPTVNDVRSLATRYGMSIKRIDAILRLKGLEAHWEKEGKQIQTGFSAGMEKILGVDSNPRLTGASTLGKDTSEADLQDQAEGKDHLRDRYVRSFWEPVADGQEAIMPGVLEDARQSGLRHTELLEKAKSHPHILRPHLHNPPKVQLVPSGSAPGRPATQFVDVGGKFIDLKEHAKRAKESERRKRLTAKKAGKLTFKPLADKKPVYLHEKP